MAFLEIGLQKKWVFKCSLEGLAPKIVEIGRGKFCLNVAAFLALQQVEKPLSGSFVGPEKFCIDL